ncbi:MAG TPA: FAD-dependent monooxygenase [Segeticoccus sp.]|uniref:FAD-dependent monooxygenase n=1 Tax=Segeticoccus sp. TaxID=2706531 RepID=UPI002D7EA818|nr:FAD-dependent monooxygenase [Segeticoccus sp.]HET8600184.1 FAD-dependent monooxygenase [Segeticoccus sp.]
MSHPTTSPAGGDPAAVEPVLVVGNGPVGQTTSLLLARWGVPVVLLDGRDHRDPVGSKAICQQRDVLDIWRAAGAGRRIADEGTTWTTARTFYRDRELFATAYSDGGTSDLPPWVNISQCRTEEVLDECLAEQPLVDVRWGHEVVGLEQSDDGVAVTCRIGRDAEVVRVRGSHAVVCAGSRASALRQQLGVSFDGHSFDDRFLICDIRADLGEWANERRFYFDPEWNRGRQVLIHACPDSTFRIDWQVPGDYDLDAEVASGALDRRIRQIIGDTDYEIVWKSVYRFHSRVVDRMRVGRVLIAGDAAHVVSPFGARGLNSGVGDAENAAWKIAFVRNGWADEELLASYDDERHAAALENLAITGATMRFLVPGNDEETRIRKDTLERAMRDESACAAVDSGRLAEPFWYHRSPLTTPDPGRPFLGRPQKGRLPRPGPGILVPDIALGGTEGDRLRSHARQGVVLVVADDGIADELAGLTEEFTAPVRVLSLAQADPAGDVRVVLGLGPEEVWVLRPDAYVAAVVPHRDLEAVRAAVRRALGQRVGIPVQG